MISAVRNTNYLGVRIHVSAPSSGLEKPIRVAFLIDNSGSMEGERLTAVKQTLHAARGLFKSEDRVTTITFSEEATVVTDNLQLTDEGLTQFYTAIDAIKTAGCTNMSAAFETLLVLGRTYDAIVLLTDGVVNRGITSTVGLRTMAVGLGTTPITALGYGPDHNRVLLRDLALRSHGSYIFVDSESLLPIAVGDLIAGLRNEVLQAAVVHVPAGWACMELGGSTASHTVGNIVPDRDYWAVFEKRGTPEETPITLSARGQPLVATISIVPVSDCQDLQEQVLRCRVAKAMVDASDLLERGQPLTSEITNLHEEFDKLSEYMLARPLVLRMKAQLAEIVATPVYAGLPPPPQMLARMASGGAYLSTQRGVTTQAPGDPCTFSSPQQRLMSIQVQTQYNV